MAVTNLTTPTSVSAYHMWFRQRWVVWSWSTILLAFFPLVVQEPYYITMAVTLLITLILTLSMNFILGFSGQWCFAHAAFFGIGAYVPAILSIRFAISPWLGLPIGVLGTLVLTVLIGTPIVRLKGYYFGVCTLSFGFLTEVIVRQAVDVTGGGYGIQRLSPLMLFGIPLHGGVYYEVALLALLITALLIDNVMRSPLGRAIAATRDNETAAAATGINVGRMRLLVFIMSSGLAAFAGWVHTFYYLTLDPSLISPNYTFLWLFMIFIGGLGHVPGVVLGTILLTIGPELLGFATEHQVLGFGLLMIIVALFAPRGLGGLLDNLIRIGSKRFWGSGQE